MNIFNQISLFFGYCILTIIGLFTVMFIAKLFLNRFSMALALKLIMNPDYVVDAALVGVLVACIFSFMYKI